MLKLRSINGDTIVEVMFALAVLALAFTISYATASAALRNAQNSQEHSLALEYIDSQLEELQYFAAQPGSASSIVFTTTAPFCLLPTGPSIKVYMIPNSNCEKVGSGFKYNISIQQTSQSPPSYDFNVFISWPGLGTLGKQSEQLSYRIYPQ